jgi:hypothetical protein
VPAKAEKLVGVYLRQGLKFFVAKVNLGEQSKLASRKLRPAPDRLRIARASCCPSGWAW